ncbi:Fe/S biogenesis protein NfuA [Candidatus Fokinia solitaria]|uniref:Fe/S biogenesis protein NfuA n=1 Tax=Candidatus Fokinia solitaria TaxID=1802984 RepID=A0A2U8BRD5_9RICK|nr:NifU family protein [Candidatus Fokinia solitaria]AWD32901.1 Fe/S biogenesis protein NfuA [Candidatus Fokinia solitaria]
MSYVNQLVSIESTPNPEAKKFVFQARLIESSTSYIFDRSSISRSYTSELADLILKNEAVSDVMIAGDFVVVTKVKGSEWSSLQMELSCLLVEYFCNSQGDIVKCTNDEEKNCTNDEISNQIKKLLDELVKPAVAQDGGDIVFVKFEEGKVYVKMTGACNGCPSSTYTLKNGVEVMLQHYIPEVVEVIAI